MPGFSIFPRPPQQLDEALIKRFHQIPVANISDCMHRMTAASRGIIGFVMNGALRDSVMIAAGNFAVFAAGITHRGPYKDGSGEINVPIAIDGMANGRYDTA